MKIEKQRLAEVIRDRRIAEGYTQTELAENAGLSLRSIQRIEKAEVLPRAFTVKALATVLNFSEQDLRPEDHLASGPNKAKKIILAAGSPPVVLLLALAFLAQSHGFPETAFELALFWAAVVLFIGLLQWMIWTKGSFKFRRFS
jgi:transcriptional regulator with XRE-family HTH domain